MLFLPELLLFAMLLSEPAFQFRTSLVSLALQTPTSPKIWKESSLAEQIPLQCNTLLTEHLSHPILAFRLCNAFQTILAATFTTIVLPSLIVALLPIFLQL